MDEIENPTPLEAALRAAARSYLAARRAAEAESAGRSELLSLMARLSLPPAGLDRLRAAACAGDLPEDVRSALATRIAVEERRLMRLGRAGHPRYDLSRHIAVRRAAKWLAGHAVAFMAGGTALASGRELNRRFSRPAPAGRKLAIGGGAPERQDSGRRRPKTEFAPAPY